MSLPQSYQYPDLLEGADCVGGQLHGDKECPSSGVTSFGRVGRNGPKSDARSVPESAARNVLKSDARSVPESDARSVPESDAECGGIRCSECGGIRW